MEEKEDTTDACVLKWKSSCIKILTKSFLPMIRYHKDFCDWFGNYYCDENNIAFKELLVSDNAHGLNCVSLCPNTTAFMQQWTLFPLCFVVLLLRLHVSWIDCWNWHGKWECTKFWGDFSTLDCVYSTAQSWNAISTCLTNAIRKIYYQNLYNMPLNSLT
jgi:hypothetical protein